MRALSLLAVGLAACGFTGEPPFAGRRIADVAPWQDIGPIVVCDGLERLGPIDDSPLGLCQAHGGAACATDGECGSRERCVCGRCALPVCDSAEECAVGTVCSFAERVCDRACTDDSQCAAGERCVPGKSVCRGTCGTDGDCQTGESCQRTTGLCAPTACEDDSLCAGGRQCDLQRLPAQLREPAPLVDGERLLLYLERLDAVGPPAIWRATSTDGLTFAFDPPRALLPGRAPSLVRTTSGYLLLYGATSGPSVLRATSSDGIAFTTDLLPALPSAESPSIIALPDGSFAAYVAIPDGTTGGRALGRATSADGLTFSPVSQVLSPADVDDPLLWHAVDRLAAPFAESLLDPAGTPFVRLWFAGHGIESAASLQFGKVVPTPADFSIGEAASLDGARFVAYPFEPVFDRVIDFLTHPSELEPAVVRFGGESRLYYRRASVDATRSENLAVARNPPRLQ